MNNRETYMLKVDFLLQTQEQAKGGGEQLDSQTTVTDPVLNKYISRRMADTYIV